MIITATMNPGSYLEPNKIYTDVSIRIEGEIHRQPIRCIREATKEEYLELHPQEANNRFVHDSRARFYVIESD